MMRKIAGSRMRPPRNDSCDFGEDALPLLRLSERIGRARLCG